MQACAQNHQAGKYKILFVLKREVSKFVFSVFPSLYFELNPPFVKLCCKSASEKLDAHLITEEWHNRSFFAGKAMGNH